MPFYYLLRSYFIQSDGEKLKAVIPTLSECIPNIHADNFIILKHKQLVLMLGKYGLLSSTP